MKKKVVIFLFVLITIVSGFKMSRANSIDENIVNGEFTKENVTTNNEVDENVINDIDDEDGENIARDTSAEISNIINEIKEGKSASEIGGMDENTYNAIKEAINENKKIEAVIDARLLKVYDISKELINIVEEEKGEAQELGYFDINLLVKVDNKQIGKITETKNNIKVTIDVNELLNMLSDIERKYSIIRIHEEEPGIKKADTLDAKLNSNGDITFETNLFSEYVVVYSNLEEEPEWKEETALNSKQDYTDLIIMGIVLVILIIIVIVIVILLKKSKSNMEV